MSAPDPERPRRAIGVDLGSVRIGVAVSAGTLATPYEVVARSGDRRRDHAAIGRLVEEAGAEVVVVGLPLSLDGSVGPAARAALDEVEELAATLDVPVETYDERLTTVTADRQLKEQGLDASARRRVVDKVAAAILLQAWLDSHPHPTP
ncbi:Holliday junction resolvase RuvX [Actinomarinicola tropica]|uniref:Putative pre-16S rRNA nuclease n=1 Tax=Actinomarinicola tropica TaxID=2789776 RepID=A0A5Q2RL54_9ACTN|nr:Holliday junction resolvase RuvX [Actinomarinicola tropica]QGG95166.1 Holliday junction resolvase RuvX [Actinomarinicola tropica]